MIFFLVMRQPPPPSLSTLFEIPQVFSTKHDCKPKFATDCKYKVLQTYGSSKREREGKVMCIYLLTVLFDKDKALP